MKQPGFLMRKYPSCSFFSVSSELRFFYQHFGAPPISLEEFEARPQAGKGRPAPGRSWGLEGGPRTDRYIPSAPTIKTCPKYTLRRVLEH